MGALRRRCSRSGMLSARSMARTSPSWSKGFTTSASCSSQAAPAISESTSTPPRPSWQARYSLHTRFMPSRKGVTSMTSLAAYSDTSDSKGSER